MTIIPTSNKANLQGYIAILLWSFSALYIDWTPQIPPLLLAASSSLVGFVFFAASWIKAPEKFLLLLKQSWKIWCLFFASVILYRLFYMSGLKLSPIIEANLLNYLWPLLILVFAGLFDQQKFSRGIYIGTAACFIGVICIGLSKTTSRLSFEYGHLLAIAGAVTWSIYSVVTRRYKGTPTDMIGMMHILGIGLFYILHKSFEAPVVFDSVSLKNYAGIIGLGLSISYGYKLWDNAMTHGDREKVTIAAYYTPLLSTIWLILFSSGRFTLMTALAAFFILGGSLYARYSTRK
jgi:drug/metabolite transporter (DMT)-like permease